MLDLVFPKECFLCSKEGFWICEKCLKDFPIISEQVCPVCEKIFSENGKICSQCRKDNPPIFQMVVASEYKDTPLAKIIHAFKYKFAEELSLPLGKVTAKAILRNKIPIPDFIIPMPLADFRLRWRGFNQSEHLAKYISKNLLPGIEIPVLNNLITREKNTTPQMEIKNYQQRKKNVENIFKINENFVTLKTNETSTSKYEKEFNLRGKNILLIDDVCTTGATVFSCAKEIKKLSPKKISVAVLARQRMN